MTTTSAGFPRRARVRAGGDFDRIFKRGRRLGTPLLVLHWLAQASDRGARLGLAVSRKVDKRAVVRVRIKRLLREHFRHIRNQLQAGDYVVVARPGAAQAAAEALRGALDDLLCRCGALPADAPALPPERSAGTMTAATPPVPSPIPPCTPDTPGA